jgi:hypothetical protein
MAQSAPSIQVEVCSWPHVVACDLCGHELPEGQVGMYVAAPGDLAIALHIMCAATLSDRITEKIAETLAQGMIADDAHDEPASQ